MVKYKKICSKFIQEKTQSAEASPEFGLTSCVLRHGLRDDLPKHELPQYTARIKLLLDLMVPLCEPYTKKQCNSFKFHWPLHWGDTRRQLGCSAAEKSLERKLGESQKRNYKFSNKKARADHEVMCSSPSCTLEPTETSFPPSTNCCSRVQSYFCNPLASINDYIFAIT